MRQPLHIQSSLHRRRSRSHRSGLTLLEILISTAILVASVTAIMQLLNVGHNSRLSAVLDAEAVLRCESVMGELISGVRPLVTSGNEAFDDDKKWTWSATVSDHGRTSLLQVDVSVQHTPSRDIPNSSWMLRRYVRDPLMFVDVEGDDE